MESNKDEALRCFHLAKNKFEQGDNAKALRFVEKSIRLYPTEKAESLAAEIRNASPSDIPFNEEPQSHGSEGNTLREDDAEDSEEEGNVEYTDQQAAAVRRIQSCKDYYDMLGVTKSATAVDLKKAYRRLALQFHPDKNKAPGAVDAFKAVGNAYSILSDDEKRKRYDQFGPEEAPSSSTPTGFARDFFAGQAEEDLLPEEIFGIFFKGGSFAKQSSDSRRSRVAQFFYTKEENEPIKSECLRLLPLATTLVLFILSSLLAKWNDSQLLYSFHQSTAYPTEKFTTTTKYRVQYYVRSSFDEDLKAWTDLQTFEEQLESHYVNDLETRCRAQRSKQKRDLSAAQFYGDSYYRAEILNRVLPSCLTLNNLQENVAIR